MRSFRRNFLMVAALILLVGAREAVAQDSPFSLDLGFGIDIGLNGNVNSGAIGRLQGLSTAILPQPYGDVYGTGINLRVGVGWALDDVNELRGIFTFQSADANLVRLGDIGPSSLYAQYSDYQSFGLELGYRRYFPLTVAKTEFRLYGEGTIGAGFIDAIDVEMAAPTANVVFNNTDFYDQSAAFMWSLNAGVLFRMTQRMDLNAQFGLKKVSGLSDVDSLQGTGLDEINNDSGRLTFPIVVGVRFRF